MLIFIATYFLAKMTSVFIASKLRIEPKIALARSVAARSDERKFASLDDFKVIVDRNIFDSRDVKVEASESQPSDQLDPNAPAVKTSLSVKLLSTFVVGDGGDSRSTATIAKNGSDADVYSIGGENQFAPGVKITKILRDRVEFINGPRLEYVEIEQFGGGLDTSRSASSIEAGTSGASPGSDTEKVEEGKFVIARSKVEGALNNLDQLMTQIGARPNLQNGKPAGMRLIMVRPGSIFADLGLKRNDILERINGQDFDMKKSLEIFGQMKDASRVTIDLVRGGKKTTLEYEIQ